MFILTLRGREREGAYYALDEEQNEILYIFEEEDDATRFAMMLEEDGSPEIHIIEVDRQAIVESCELSGCGYAIITKNDFVIPPKGKNDFI